MDPKTLHIVAQVVRFTATWGVGRIVKGAAMNQVPVVTVLDKVLVTAGSWGIACAVNEKVGPAAERQVHELHDNVMKINAAIQEKNTAK